MTTYNCLIVDDEPIAREIIIQYCENFPYLNVITSCENAFEASAYITNNKIDILLLDINMPMLDGISFLKTVTNKPQVILTTAYKEFAIESYEIGVCDYLLKPFTIERFLKAIQKAIANMQNTPKLNQNNTAVPTSEIVHSDILFIKTDTKTFKIPYAEVLFIESRGNYTVIVTEKEEHQMYMPLYKIEELLTGNHFMRVHRSFIVSKNKIRETNAQQIKMGSHTIPIGRKFKTEVRKQL